MPGRAARRTFAGMTVPYIAFALAGAVFLVAILLFIVLQVFEEHGINVDRERRRHSPR